MDKEFLDELNDMYTAAVEGLNLTGTEWAVIGKLTDEPFDLQEEDLETIADIITKAKATPPPPRMIEEYEITQALHVGQKEVVFGQAEKPTAAHGNCPYLVGICSYNNPFDAPWPEKMTGYTDFAEAVSAYVSRVQAQLEAVKAERQQRGDNPPLTQAHCIPGSEYGDYTGKVVVHDASVLRPEFQYADHQIYLASGGNGCNPEGHGRAVFATNLYSGEETRINRPDVLGIIQPVFMPEWATAKLAEIQSSRADMDKPTAEKRPKGRGTPGKDER